MDMLRFDASNWPTDPRIVIGGGPKTGKSTLSRVLDGAVHHTDDLIGLGWSEASQAVAEMTAEPGPWVIEGVATVRALRKALAATDGAPCDVLIWLVHPWQHLSKGQLAMAKGCQTVLAEIAPQLRDRGVIIERLTPSTGPPS